MGDARFLNEIRGRVVAHRVRDDEVHILRGTASAASSLSPTVECIVDEFQRLRYTLEPGLRADVRLDHIIVGAAADACAVIDRTRCPDLGEPRLVHAPADARDDGANSIDGHLKGPETITGFQNERSQPFFDLLVLVEKTLDRARVATWAAAPVDSPLQAHAALASCEDRRIAQSPATPGGGHEARRRRVVVPRRPPRVAHRRRRVRRDPAPTPLLSGSPITRPCCVWRDAVHPRGQLAGGHARSPKR